MVFSNLLPKHNNNDTSTLHLAHDGASFSQRAAIALKCSKSNLSARQIKLLGWHSLYMNVNLNRSEILYVQLV